MVKQGQKRAAKAYPKRAKPLPDPFKVFTHACRFMLADEQVRRKGDGGTSELHEFVWLALPSTVLSAFACELFFKTLMVLEGKLPIETHNLNTLYKRLDNKSKNELDVRWRVSMIDAQLHLDEIERLKGKKLKRNLREALTDCGDAFINTRYYYEDPQKSRYYLTTLPRVLYEFTLNRKPEWDADQNTSRAIASAVRANRPT
ncbi:hypothetical protein [Microvirga sp. VF16]|uniref:hypothetical protein n=1 Tax=Microvirga sp. VF16 TaxID=2807101 RepID=UPI00193E3D6C|nr:hypothetical protein [Microvirga sp. VF16]QRM27905.1 hypothetical protein JO965_16785 [Microvirga sp. VF16]